MSCGELAYLRRRLEEERALAAQITHPPEQRFHRRLADLYDLRIQSHGDQPGGAPGRTSG